MSDIRVRKTPNHNELDVERMIGGTAHPLTNQKLDPSHPLGVRKGSLTHDEVIHPGLRFHDPSKRVIVYEHRPMIKMLKYYFMQKQYGGNAPFEFTEVPIPWQVYVIKYNANGTVDGLRVFWRNSQLKGMDSALGEALFTNRGMGGRICLPDSASNPNPTRSISHIIDIAFNAVWSAGFNYNINLPLAVFGAIDQMRGVYGEQYPEMFRGISRAARGEKKIHSIFPTHGHSLEDVVRQYWPSMGARGEYGDRAIKRGANPVDGHGDRCLDEHYLSLGTVVNKFYGSESFMAGRNQTTSGSLHARLIKAITPTKMRG